MLKQVIASPRRLTTGALLVGLTAALISVASSAQQRTAQPQVTVYKSSTCGCCSKWVEHMKAAGFAVTAMDVPDIEVPKKTYGVPESAKSCHTAVVGGYVVEGHVPADLVQKMLSEKPAIAGIATPGMPVGSPGMEVPGFKDPYNVIAFDKAGKTSIYAKR
jgi:hypothetical protein